MSKAANYSKILLVEGNNDKHVVLALCEKYQVAMNFCIEDCGGIGNLTNQEYISARFKQSGINTIGIIIDADTNLQTRWEKLNNALIANGFNVPKIFPKDGLIIENTDKKIGAWLMPDNNNIGMLEDFISFLIPKEDKLLPIVDKTLTEIENQKLNKYSNRHRSKAKIHTWLAWQEDPGTPMGLSITKKYLSTDEELCKKFVHWITELFKEK